MREEEKGEGKAGELEPPSPAVSPLHHPGSSNCAVIKNIIIGGGECSSLISKPKIISRAGEMTSWLEALAWKLKFNLGTHKGAREDLTPEVVPDFLSCHSAHTHPHTHTLDICSQG